MTTGRAGTARGRASNTPRARAARILRAATLALGTAQAAKAFLGTPNFALGGATPRDLLRTAQGEQQVLAELQAQGTGGPV